MTTSARSSDNKAALRASLKKEDESLAERLAPTEVPLAETLKQTGSVPLASDGSAAAETPAAVADDQAAAQAPSEPAGKRRATKTGDAKTAQAAAKAEKPAAKAAAKPPAKAAAKATKKPAPAPAPAPARARSGKAPAGKAKAAEQCAAPPTAEAVVAGKDAAKTAGKKASKVEEAIEKIEKSAKEKRDKLVSFSVELLKSEEAAIDALRAELSKAVGWAASKSDILRAGVRLFAEQKAEQMKELLASLASVPKGKK